MQHSDKKQMETEANHQQDIPPIENEVPDIPVDGINEILNLQNSC